MKIHLLFSFVFLSNLLFSQHLLHTDGSAIVNEQQDTIILRGMGLGGWMLQEGYMLQTASFANSQHKLKEKIEELIGIEASEDFYDAWLANHVTKTDIDSLKSWGFNSVRLPMHYNLYTLPIEDEPILGQNTWLNRGFEMTDSLISWCAQNEMYVVLDLHAAPGGQGYDEGISDYDPEKPSLWESQTNKDKMASFWKRLAERYKDEQWIAGYDLLNEPNWNLPGGTALRNLYGQVTDSIRSVDTDHIIFIEGNWFANDFTGLTPPWDNNMVYSPHKYWSINDEASMQFALGLRDQYNIPLYLGESGENSNVWFRDAIKLMEDLDIGWAWWPMKKIDAIAGPLSVEKTPEYQYLLNYWSGSASAPTQEYAVDALMQIADDFKMENCIYQKDVIDAMFRQVQSDETLPFIGNLTLPGLVHASEYDLGIIGEAYYDIQAANYQVSTGNFTEWNTGWTYRNDGVDIEDCDDAVNSNGYNVGWIDSGEWMKYSIASANAGVYDVHLRVAAGTSGGLIHFSADGTDISIPVEVASTGAWDNWESLLIENIILSGDEQSITFHADQEGFNLSSFEFIQTSTNTSSLSTSFISAKTLSENSIELTLNKPLSDPLQGEIADFEIKVNGDAVPITDIELDAADNKRAIFEIDYELNSLEIIKISYNGNQIDATDGTALSHFTNEDVENTLRFAHPIPGRIEAEAYFDQSGIQLENCTDIGGGENIGFLDPSDYLDYEVDVEYSGTYAIGFRTAAQYGNGKLELQSIDESGQSTALGQYTFDPTGGWQTWETTRDSIELDAGKYTLRLLVEQGPLNVNWFEFEYDEEIELPFFPGIENIIAFPNPAQDEINISFAVFLSQDLDLSIYDSRGSKIHNHFFADTALLNERVSILNLQDGVYHIQIRKEDGTSFTKKFVKISN